MSVLIRQQFSHARVRQREPDAIETVEARLVQNVKEHGREGGRRQRRHHHCAVVDHPQVDLTSWGNFDACLMLLLDGVLRPPLMADESAQSVARQQQLQSAACGHPAHVATAFR